MKNPNFLPMAHAECDICHSTICHHTLDMDKISKGLGAVRRGKSLKSQDKTISPQEDRVRPSFDDIYMQFAQSLSRRSTCQRSQVGVVIVSMDNHRVLSLGYNGGPRGGFNDCLSMEPGKCGHLHSEINALIKLDFNDPSGKKLYTTMEPCLNCAIAIVNGGIQEVHYLHTYRDHAGLEVLQKAGILIKR